MKKIVLYLLVFISGLNLFSMEVGDTAEFDGCDLSKEEATRLLGGSTKLKLNYTEINGEEIVSGEAIDLEAGQVCSHIISLMNEFTLLDSPKYLNRPNMVLADSKIFPDEVLSMILRFIPLNEQNFENFFNCADIFGLDSINRKRLELFLVGLALNPNPNQELYKHVNKLGKQLDDLDNPFKHIMPLDCFLYHIEHLCSAIESDLNICNLNGIKTYLTTNLNFIKN